MSIVRIGSRQSRLAVIQAEIVKQQIERAHPGVRVEIITMKTTGDKILDKSLAAIGGKGLFVKELDKALLNKEIDLAVHSLKDVPMETDERLPILACTKREDVRDVLLLKRGRTEADLKKEGAVIGTSSRRRALQLEKLYPQCRFAGIRGNVQTRLSKLEKGEYTATVLAAAGLARLGMEDIIDRYFTVEEILPAAGQGILAIQGRYDETYPYLEGVRDEEAQIAGRAERAFVKALNGGCTSPVAAYARIKQEMMELRGLYYEEGQKEYRVDVITGDKEQAEKWGISLAEKMKKEAGR
ncbi:hydroxymethylbilane synthase [Mediterraneibacter massiliensis]|uniref:hydroxymethylbilane synthase n=1 Tax=Mediterraneibacter massiliensis TaxID=1720300 RepID=UPI0024AE8492|nr:hydroxymethylbilane synthase [Mediterraneibacter massiliensis]